MPTENELKQQLQAIAANEYRVPDNVDVWQVTQDMLVHIGSIDPELRDGLIYHVFVKWAQAELYTPDQYRSILEHGPGRTASLPGSGRTRYRFGFHAIVLVR